MLENLKEPVSELCTQVNSYLSSIRRNELSLKVDEYEAESSVPGFWEQPEQAQALMKKLNQVKLQITEFDALRREADDLQVLLDMALEENDASLESEVQTEYDTLKKKMATIELKRLLSGKHDSANAILSITAGAGGTDAQDWAQMLYRMYTRWIEQNGFAAEELEISYGEEAGIKGATLLVTGPYAYGYLLAERGVHRLVRISPFNANDKRQTSFAAVEVVPEMDDDIKLDIKAEDLRIDTFRASGPGGQHVNKTDSAVRITHLPTGTVVQSQNRRSQLANREAAMHVLQSRLLLIMEEEKKQELEQLRGHQTEIGWGNQIRNYVFQPYKLVKDTRTGHETSDVDGVMDGDLNPFIQDFLRQRVQV